MNFFYFVIDNRRFLGFGFALMFFSSFGQTFLIALFGNHIRDAFGLSHGDFGAIYSLATVASAIALIWTGRKIDELDLRLYVTLVAVGLIGACFMIASANGIIFLVISLFALRFAGQGLMSHAASTSMSRYFDRQRGKALTISSMGFAAGEAILPAITVAMIAALGWRQSWSVFGVALTVVAIPLLLWLLGNHQQRQKQLFHRTDGGKGSEALEVRHWTHTEMLRDKRFYIIMPAAIGPAMILTGLFFHQAFLAQSKNWSLEWVATCFIAFAASKIVATLLAGPMVDKIGAIRLMPYFQLPLIIGLLVLGLSDHPAAAMIYFSAAGLTTGFGMTTIGAMWAEVYGIAHLGAIKALTGSLFVFATALAPVAMGWLFDIGSTVNDIAFTAAAYSVLTTIIVSAGFVNRHPR